MSAKLWKASTSNAFQTTLNGNVLSGDSSITLTSVTGLQAPGVLVIDRVDANGTATNSLREYISFTGISTNTLTGVSRGLGGSTAQSHTSGAVVEETFSVTHWGDLLDFLAVSHNSSGNIVASNATLTNATLITPFISSATITTANIATLNVLTQLVTSNASIVGLFPSGASGAYLVSQGNSLPPVYSVSSTNNLTNANMVDRTRSIWLPANMFQSAEGSPTLSAGTDADTPSAWLLDPDATVESVAGQFIVPEDYSTGNLTIKIYFAMVSATSGSVVLDTRIISVANNGSVVGAGTSQSDTISVPGTAGLLKIATRGATVSTGGAGEMVRVSVRRLGSNGSDGATGDMRFLGIKVEYTADM